MQDAYLFPLFGHFAFTRDRVIVIGGMALGMTLGAAIGGSGATYGGSTTSLSPQKLSRVLESMIRISPRNPLKYRGPAEPPDPFWIDSCIRPFLSFFLAKARAEKDYEANMNDTLDDLDNTTLAITQDFGKLISMTDEEFENHQKLKKEFRDALKSLEK